MGFEKGYEAVWFEHGMCLLHVSLNDHGFHHRKVKEVCNGLMFEPSIMELAGDSLNWHVKVKEFDDLGAR